MVRTERTASCSQGRRSTTELHPDAWTAGDSNAVPPVCRTGALPGELAALDVGHVRQDRPRSMARTLPPMTVPAAAERERPGTVGVCGSPAAQDVSHC
jgi:hypothetical protein